VATDPTHATRLALATLTALQQTLTADFPQNQYIGKKYADQFNAALDSLARLGFDVSEMRLSPSEVAARVSTANYMTNEKRYSEPSVERNYLLMKVNTVLGYFSLGGGDPPKTIGFRPPTS
jgi:predicted transcriptional regulator